MEFDNILIGKIDKLVTADCLNLERLSKEHKELNSDLLIYKERLVDAEAGRVIIQKVAKEVQERIKFQISSIVASALDSVFDDAYSFKIDFVERRGKIEADLLFIRDGEEMNPFDSAGGGVLDVTSFSLRLTFLFFKANRKLLILDEPFRFVSVDLQSRCSAMLKLISEKLGFQIIMVSHLPEIISSADKIYTISNGKIIGQESEKKELPTPKIKRLRVKND